MESFFSRYRNLIVLLAVLLVQVIGLAVQVRKPGPAIGPPAAGNAPLGGPDGRGVRLIRLWTAQIVSPFERAIHGSGEVADGWWNDYIDLRHTRDQNRELQKTIDRLRLEQAELREDALQGQRLQGLLKFQETYVYKTTPAQVIGTSGSLQSRVVWLDKGSADGLDADNAVITPDGIVGKVREVFKNTAQVLMINDQTSGAGVVLETTRIRGILRGDAAGQPQVVNILADQRIQPGERVLTAGGDHVFPRGLPVGVVERVARDPERGSFINVIIKPAANLQHLDEVLVITSLDTHLSPEQQADLATSQALKGAEVAAEVERKKAAAEMAERLPGLKDPNAPATAPDAKEGDDQPTAGPPLPPIAPKPVQPKHPDRFTPGNADQPAAGDANSSTPDTPDSGGGEDSPAQSAPKPQPVAPHGAPAAKPNSTAPATPKTPPATKPAPQSGSPAPKPTKPAAPQFAGRAG